MQSRKSEINKSYQITNDEWVLTLARKTTGSHKEHAFFILEGIQDEMACIWFMDLVGQPLIPNLKKAGIRIRHYQANKEELTANPLIYSCSLTKHGGREPVKNVVMMDLRADDEIAKQMWFISEVKAKELIEIINQDKLNPPNFNLLGKNSIFNISSAEISGTDTGHSCFTYSKSKILDLNCPNIQLESSKFSDWVDNIASITSLTLKPEGKKTNFHSFCFWATTVAIAVPVVAYGAAIAIDACYPSPK